MQKLRYHLPRGHENSILYMQGSGLRRNSIDAKSHLRGRVQLVDFDGISCHSDKL